LTDVLDADDQRGEPVDAAVAVQWQLPCLVDEQDVEQTLPVVAGPR
jgi:hypothetical protein